MGTAKACSMACNADGARWEANLRKARNAASRTLRLRTPLCRSCSRWSRKARINAGVMSARFIAAGQVPKCRWANVRNSVKASRYPATVRGLSARCPTR